MLAHTVRNATLNDAADIGLIGVLSWQVAYRGLMPDDFLDSLDVEKRTHSLHKLMENPDITILVVNDHDNIVGFSILNTSRDADAAPATGEIGAIYVHPDKWKRGFGRALLSASIDQARERGFDEITLWVVEGNQRARGFYEYLGFTSDGAVKDIQLLEDVTVREVRYRLKLRT
jgi:ribosomal protein S18 acetylase RimI-like enzyme